MTNKPRSKRRRSTLTLYLDRVADGDDSARERLCASLADRLLQVPLDAGDDSYQESRQEGVRIRVLQMKHAGREVVPIFTDSIAYKEWQICNPEVTEVASLMGADLCTVLPAGIALLVDPGSESEVLLDNDSVNTIARIGQENLEAEFGAMEVVAQAAEQLQQAADQVEQLGEQVGSAREDIIELRETDIVEVGVPLEELQPDKVEKIVAATATEESTPEPEEDPVGLKGWLGI